MFNSPKNNSDSEQTTSLFCISKKKQITRVLNEANDKLYLFIHYVKAFINQRFD